MMNSCSSLHAGEVVTNFCMQVTRRVTNFRQERDSFVSRVFPVFGIVKWGLVPQENFNLREILKEKATSQVTLFTTSLVDIHGRDGEGPPAPTGSEIV